MKFFGLVVIGIFAGLISHAANDEYHTAIVNGADAKYLYRVVDDVGVPVSNALVRVWCKSYGRPDDNGNWETNTAENGTFEIAHRVNERLTIGVDKEGYYHSRDEIYYLGEQHPQVRDGKWQPYGGERRLVLKPIKNPHKMVGPERPMQKKIPAYRKWIGYDFELCEFVEPLGKGRYSDVLIRFNLEESNSTEWKITMDISFTNQLYAGAYRMKKDVYSDMKSVYVVDTNAVFNANFTFGFIKRRGGRVEKTMLGSDEYMVFRTRTKVDSKGSLISARYGKLYGLWRFEDAGGMRIANMFINEAEDDINLEDQTTIDYMKKFHGKVKVK